MDSKISDINTIGLLACYLNTDFVRAIAINKASSVVLLNFLCMFTDNFDLTYLFYSGGFMGTYSKCSEWPDDIRFLNNI